MDPNDETARDDCGRPYSAQREEFDPDDYTVSELRAMRRSAEGAHLREIEVALALRDGGKLS